MEEVRLGIFVVAAVLGFIAIWLVFYFIPVGLWFSALVSGVKINLLQLFLMRWRRVPPGVIVSSMIEGTKAGLSLDANELEAHYLAGGNVDKVIDALIAAERAGIELNFSRAAAIDLADKVGSVEPGKQGDLVIWDAPDLNYICYRFGSNLVKNVIKTGKIVR